MVLNYMHHRRQLARNYDAKTWKAYWRWINGYMAPGRTKPTDVDGVPGVPVSHEIEVFGEKIKR